MQDQPTVIQIVRDASRQEPDNQVRRFDLRLPVFQPCDPNVLRRLLQAFNG